MRHRRAETLASTNYLPKVTGSNSKTVFTARSTSFSLISSNLTAVIVFRYPQHKIEFD